MPMPEYDDDAIDAMRELLNVGVDQAAAVLSELIGRRIELTIPSVRICRGDDCRERLYGELQHQTQTVISQEFDGTLGGCASLCFAADSSLALARLLSGEIGESSAGLDAELSGILLEVGNIVLNGVMGSLSNSICEPLAYRLPELRTAEQRGVPAFPASQPPDDMLIGDVTFQVSDERIEGSIAILFAIGSLANVVQAAFESSVA